MVKVFENFQDFLLEKENIDVVDLKKMPMKKDFMELNKKFFNNKLHLIPFKLDNSKKHMGVVRTKNGNIIEFLAISNFYQYTRQEYLNTLAHEMIHVEHVQNDTLEADPHGRLFKKRAAEIMAQDKAFTIEKSGDVRVNQEKKELIYCVIFTKDKVRFSGAFFTEKMYHKKIEDIVKHYKALIEQHPNHPWQDELIIYKSDNPDLLKFPKSRGVSRGKLTSWQIPTEELNMIEASELIKTIKLK